MDPIKILSLIVLAVFSLGYALPSSGGERPPGTTPVPPSPQRSGNAAAGYKFLTTGDILRAGIPLSVFRITMPKGTDDDLGRTGDNDGIPFQFNVVKAPNGVKVVAPNCLNCHAEKLNGKVIVGLGSNTLDHSYDLSSNFRAADFAVQLNHGKVSKEWEAYFPLSRGFKSVAPYIITSVRGLNPADKIFASLAAYRNAADLSWLEVPQFDVPRDVVPTDVPAWWLLKKKNALYYNALGVGDFARLSSASGMLTMTDSTEARYLDERMVDVIAWIRTLEPPPYPYPVDAALAEQGKAIFDNTCKKCHGSYGKDGEYPNLVVDLDRVGTDPLLAQSYQQYPEYHTWYNSSWYAQGPHKAELLPTDGYIAPPLDGVWATAPYLHNGSVPTIDDLLNSEQRPTYWKRSFTNDDYNPEKLGWNYSSETEAFDSEIYDTTLPGYGNGGHTFGDKLSPEERKAVLEYLKTL